MNATNPERDELILIVRDVDGDYHGTGPLALSGAEAALIADAVLAAGYRKTDEDREEFAVRVDDPEYWGYEIEPAETLQKARVSAWKRRGASVVRRTVSEWVPVDEKGGQS